MTTNPPNPPVMPAPTNRPRRRWIIAGIGVVVLVVAGLILEGIVFDGNESSSTPRSAATTTQPTTPLTRTVQLIALTRGGPVPVFAAPDSTTPTAELSPTTQFGSTRSFYADQRHGDWLRVFLPTRPNESRGWVRVTDVVVERPGYIIRVDRAAHKLSLHMLRSDGTDGETVLEAIVAIGEPSTPTPVGTFYVTDLLKRTDPGGTYGPAAFGLSGHSDVLTEFLGGDGQTAIHGTNRPELLGQDVSNGCIRIPNDVALRLLDLLRLGTPVVVT